MHIHHRQLESDLSHIRQAISFLEQTRSYLSLRSPVGDPAYWEARLNALRDSVDRGRELEKHIEKLYDRVQRLSSPRSVR